jgi:hypothetical protein
MSSITQSEYFFYGSSTIDDTGSHVQYGLFNAIDNRFVLTSAEPDILNWISFLFSSRYNLSVYRLTTAENFQPNLIDNEVCTRWTIGNNQMLQFTKSSDWRSIIDIKTLVECPIDMPLGLLADDIPYLMAAHSWISSCLERCRLLGIEHILTSKLIDLPLSDPAIDQCRQVFMTIYHEPDFEKARSTIGF